MAVRRIEQRGGPGILRLNSPPFPLMESLCPESMTLQKILKQTLNPKLERVYLGFPIQRYSMQASQSVVGRPGWHGEP